MANLVQLLVAGLGIGSIYALVALAFVLIYRAANVINFAQGDFSMVAAYLMVTFAVDLELPYWLAIVLSLVCVGLLGACFNRLVFYPLRNRGHVPVMISTIGASILMSNLTLALCGPQPRFLPGLFAIDGLHLGSVFIDAQYLAIFVVTILLFIFQYWLFEKTTLGKRMQAVSQNKTMASLLGIRVSHVIMFTFVYSAVLGGVAGILVAPILFVNIQLGSLIAFKAFAATIIGGFGSIGGAMVGGLALGIIETFCASYISAPYKDGFAFIILVLFLFSRPQGLFGELISEKV